MANKWEKFFKQAINLNIPVKFSYWSNKSKFFTGAETPTHDRIVAPLVLGYKQFKNGTSGVFLRAWLLSKYSYSRNKYFDNKFTANSRRPSYYRLYNVAKMKNVVYASDFPKEKRFYPAKHKDYNPNDKFFNQILYSQPANYSYSYYFDGKQEDSTNYYIIKRIKDLIESYRIKIIKPIRYYRISELEEVGFEDEKFLNINLNWVENVKESFLIKGLKRMGV